MFLFFTGFVSFLFFVCCCSLFCFKFVLVFLFYVLILNSPNKPIEDRENQTVDAHRFYLFMMIIYNVCIYILIWFWYVVDWYCVSFDLIYIYIIVWYAVVVAVDNDIYIAYIHTNTMQCNEEQNRLEFSTPSFQRREFMFVRYRWMMGKEREETKER